MTRTSQDKSILLSIALGEHVYATWFLLLCMVVFPAAFFLRYPWLVNCAWVLLFVLGLFVFITGYVSGKQALASRQWPKAECTLESLGMKSQRNNRHLSYRPDIGCRFTVSGSVYEGTEFDLGTAYESKTKVQNKLDTLEKQLPLFVYYDPNDPAINTLHPGLRSVHWLRLLFGSVAMAVPVASLMGWVVWS